MEIKQNKLKLSVVMSVYNGERYLRQSIESVLSQSFRGFEFLVVNDGSKDNTLDILNYYAKKDARIKILNNEKNIGLTRSLNKALNVAKGEYIARMDADDISFPQRFEKQLRVMENNLGIALCGSFAIIIDKNGTKISEKKLAVNYQEIKNKLLFNNQFVHSSLFFRKSVGKYDNEFEKAQDYEFVFRIASKHPVVNLPEYLIKWRNTKDSLSFSDKKQQKYAIKARWFAITKYGYSKTRGIFHIILRTIYLLVPHGFTIRRIKK